MHFDQNKTIGALGTLVVAKWYRARFPKSLLISMDSAETRRWMNLDDESKRADLLGLSVHEGAPRIDVLEVKSGVDDATSVYTIDGAGHLKGKPIDQLQNTGKSIEAIFGLNEWKDHVLTPPRREILRNHLYRQGLASKQPAQEKLFWSKTLNELFAGDVHPSVHLNLVLVNLGLNEQAVDELIDTSQGKKIRLVYLNADTVNAHLKGTGSGAVVGQSEEQADRETDLDDAESHQFETTKGDVAADRLGGGGKQPTSRKMHSLKNAADSTKERLDVVDEKQQPVSDMSSPPNLAPPSLELMKHIETMCEKIKAACQDFSVRVVDIDPANVEIGPSVLRYKIELAPGEDALKLRKQAENIARQLAAKSVPIMGFLPGTHFEYLDLPRPDRQDVMLEPLLPQLTATRGKNINQLNIQVGVDPSGRAEVLDLGDDKAPHILVAGGTGSGKTIFLYSVVLSLVAAHKSNTLELVIIDPKQTDFPVFAPLPHLRNGEVITDGQAGVDAIQELVEQEMQSRSVQLQKTGYRDITSYNAEHPKTPIKAIVVVIDEYADLVAVLSKKERERFERVVSRLAARGRNVGIHLVLATQRPTADIVTGNIKANMPCRISFSLPSGRDSQVVLDETGAERLLRKGDMLLSLEGRLRRLQGYFVHPKSLPKLIKELGS